MSNSYIGKGGGRKERGGRKYATFYSREISLCECPGASYMEVEPREGAAPPMVPEAGATDV